MAGAVVTAAGVPGLLAAVGVLAEVGYPLASGSGRAALTGVAVVACCGAAVTHAAATRGWRTAGALVGVFGVGGWLVEAVGVVSGVPFGSYAYGTALGPAPLGVPLLVGLAWCMTAWPAYLAALHLCPRRPRTIRVPLAAAALASWDLFLDPQMVDAGYWTWHHPTHALPGLPGIPITNYAGWLLTAALLMTVFELTAGHRAAAEPRSRRRDAVPLSVYFWTYCSSVLAHAAFLHLPGSALWGGVVMGSIVVPLAVQLARR